jgi:hypothetical protein
VSCSLGALCLRMRLLVSSLFDRCEHVRSAQYEMRLRPSWRNQSRPYLRGVPTWSSHVPARYMCTKWPQRRVRFEKLRSQELPTLNRRQRDR